MVPARSTLTQPDHALLDLRAHQPEPRPVDPGALDRVRHLLREGGVLALTGAGMSTASGIPDYRGPDGTRRVQPMPASEFARSPGGRRRYWARSALGWPRFALARPNPAHRALAGLTRAGRVAAVVTQNVDGLDRACGTAPLVELHGALDRVVCLDCADLSPRAELQERLRAANPDLASTVQEVRPDGDVVVPESTIASFVLVGCRRCGSERLKPDVVFFGASVDPALVAHVYGLVECAGAVLVLGSSLQVMSGLRFVRRAHELGLPVAVVTRGPVRREECLDPRLRLDARLSDVLPLLAGDGLRPAAAPR